MSTLEYINLIIATECSRLKVGNKYRPPPCKCTCILTYISTSLTIGIAQSTPQPSSPITIDRRLILMNKSSL